MIVSVPPTMPGLINSINTNIHVGVSTRLFDIAYLLGVSVPFPRSPPRRLSQKFRPCRVLMCRLLYSSPWHQPSTLYSRDFSPLTKQCSIMRSWSRKRPHMMETTFPVAMKRRKVMIIGSTRRASHRHMEIRLRFLYHVLVCRMHIQL